MQAGRVKWPMSTIRLRSKNRQQLIDLCVKILNCWRNYSDESVDIFAETDQPHNTITPIGRRRGDQFEFDLVLRNNRTTADHPLGLFHPHAEVHHIKKENIGLIEVMGLAVLPARLKNEMALVKNNLLNGVKDISNINDISIHADWYKKILAKHSINLKHNELYDYVYVYNMGNNDFMGSSIMDEKHLALYVKDVIDDEDGYDGIVFNRWYADTVI